ncbi:F-box domain protein [Oesophagostomum dentatum]|uniref:F-box domain protein n=1 Tax=Oesophagostomum dentatum TaxID=61180 RepID=A0A0B1TDB8_OESDE|nr:F-box domain protein [Oesophagostomum dentatum]
MATLIKTLGEVFTSGRTKQPHSNAAFPTDESLWFEVLKRCDKASLIRAEQACRLFRKILKTSQFWIEKCEYDGVALPSLNWRKFIRQEADSVQDSDGPSVPYEFDYKRICFCRPFNRNLAIPLTNTSTINNLKKKGMVFRGGGDGIIIEHPPVYCEQTEVPVCFATSYLWCSRYFEIDLEKVGVQDWVMDFIRPEIIVRERCACREDCGAVYELRAQLLKDDEQFDENVILPRFLVAERTWNQWEGGKSWDTVEHVLKDYPSGMRKLGVMSRGKDTLFWAGNYGSKFGATEVLIKLPDTPRIVQIHDFLMLRSATRMIISGDYPYVHCVFLLE